MIQTVAPNPASFKRYPLYLRREAGKRSPISCAGLCHGDEGELGQISFSLATRVQTTERYIGCRQTFREAVNDRFQISLVKNVA